MFRKYLIVLITLMIIILLSYSRSESKGVEKKIDLPYLSESADNLRLVVVTTKDKLEEEIKKINKSITEWHILRANVYDTGDAEGKQLAEQYDLQSYPAYLLFDDKGFIEKKPDLDQAIAEAWEYHEEFYLTQSNLMGEMTAKEEGTYSINVFWEGGKSEYQSLIDELLGVIHSDKLHEMAISNLSFVNLNNHVGPYNYKVLLDLKDTPVIVILDTSRILLQTTRSQDIVDYFYQE